MKNAKRSSHRICPCFGWALSVIGCLPSHRGSGCMVSWPNLLKRYSSLIPKPKSTFQQLWFRGSALSSASALPIPFFMTAAQVFAPPSLPWSFSCPSQTCWTLVTIIHTPMSSRLRSLGGHSATLLKYLNNPLKIFYWELLSTALQLYHDHCRVSLSLWNSRLLLIQLKRHSKRCWCPRACCQAKPFHLLLGKLIFENKHRISNLAQCNVMYRLEIIPGFFFKKWIYFLKAWQENFWILELPN